ncbi:hypothetical protein [Pseudomonas mucidolens]|uniref:Uncharacterized protein n=1 Tax=Pseudomonas mucidolens TaxID=46679 RepID=A0A1H2LQM0_9PSED|nr:hypothetical protein [Pseudomonas mucidolens]SDU83229.1 hypothetical protein SAMN05216202_0253 [Pseudomonas mucidolens]SQH35760.1 Uncharacterised protein [Pseudomonas mucidolens]
MLAKNVNDTACFLDKRGADEFFASNLAPTVIAICLIERHSDKPPSPPVALMGKSEYAADKFIL